MKIDRLIGILMYLLNRDKVTGAELARHFEVSPRTIARDMDTLGMAGIPVTSSTGANGGYAILDTYRLNQNIATTEDYFHVIFSLKSICSAYENKKIEATLEKFLTLKDATPRQQRIFMDFEVCKEDPGGNRYGKTLEQAIAGKRVIRFDYTSAAGTCLTREAEPLALSYRWYAWYLLAYCRLRRDYRLFKLRRMQNLTLTEKPFQTAHGEASAILQRQWSKDQRHTYSIRIKCKKRIRVPILEYFNGQVVQDFPNGDFLFSFTVPQDERMWFSLLLGFGSDVQVLEPAQVRMRLCENSRNILNLYENDDRQLS